MDKVTGNVESKSRKGNSIKVGGDWYSTFKSQDLDHINWKDDVEFLYEQKGEYKNIKGKVTKTAGGGSVSNTSGGGKPFSNLGVELGHASNLAMRMMEQEVEGAEVGTAAYFKQFVTYTDQMYKVMKSLRAKHEIGEDPKPVIKEESKAVKAAPVEEDDDDLF